MAPLAQALSTEFITLPEDKRTRTTLRVRVPPATEARPLTLPQRPNMSALYTRILGLWDIAESDVVPVTPMKVAFSWLDAEDRRRVMIMRKENDACLKYLLEQIDECPCWEEEDGLCLLDVDIMLK